MRQRRSWSAGNEFRRVDYEADFLCGRPGNAPELRPGQGCGPLAQVMVRGLDKVDQLLTLTMAAYNLTRLRALAELRPQVAQ